MEHLRSYAQQLQKMNGKTDSNGMPSQGAQELAQKVNENEKTGILQKVADFLSSPLTKPTTSYPVYYQRATDIIVEPALSDGSWTLGNLLIEYIKVPSEPVWNSSADSNGALTYNSSGSTDFTLHESDRVQLILGILKYAGLVIQDPTVIQAASAEENKTTQLENL